MMPSGLQICLFSLLTFELLHPSCCNTMGIYRNSAHWVSLKFIRQFWNTSPKEISISTSCDLDLWPTDPSSWVFNALAPSTTCANLHLNRCSRFQNIMFTSLVANERMDNWTGWEHNSSACYIDGGININKSTHYAHRPDPKLWQCHMNHHRFIINSF